MSAMFVSALDADDSEKVGNRNQHRQAEKQATDGLREREEEQGVPALSCDYPDSWLEPESRGKQRCAPFSIFREIKKMKSQTKPISEKKNFPPCFFSIYS